MKKVLYGFHAFIERFSLTIAYLILAITCFIVLEVISRYFFRSPTSWVWLANKQLFGVFVLSAGIYAISTGRHIRIEIFYHRVPPWMKLTSRVITLFFFIIFVGCLVWQGAWMGQESFAVKETSLGNFPMPLYLLKIFIPIAAFIYLLQGIIGFFLGKDK